MDIDEAPLLEELVDGVGRHAAHPEGGGEQVGAGAQVLDGAQELHGVALLLQRIVGGGGALHGDLGSFQLKGLLGVGGEHQLAGDDEGGAHILLGDLVVVGQRAPVHDHLQVVEAAAIVQGDEAKGLHVAQRAHPAGHSQLAAAHRAGVGVDISDRCTVQRKNPFSQIIRVPLYQPSP